MNRKILVVALIIFLAFSIYIGIGWVEYKKNWEKNHQNKETYTCATFDNNFAPYGLNTTAIDWGK